MRHEIKSRLNAAEAVALRARLRAVMARDPHVDGSGAYWIHSVYFDTPDDRALKEKQVGLAYRDKYRIRYYNEDRSVFHLERKSKRGSLCDKAGVTLSLPEVRRVLAGDTAWMADDPRALVRELYLRMRRELLRPRVQVHYKREPYVYAPGNVRVTLDSEIRTGLMNTDFLSATQARVRTQGEDFVLLEVKYDAYLPEIISEITRCACRPTSFSKFEACHSYD